MKRQTFAQEMKGYLASWASKNEISADMVEPRWSWVLKPYFRSKNLYRGDDWWKFIQGKEHLWARALNSSQCFAINLFAPLKDNGQLALAVLPEIASNHNLDKLESVRVDFEYIPDRRIRELLGETQTKQPTQVDVVFTVSLKDGRRGYVLVEVKLTESKFGKCRGAEEQEKRLGKDSPCTRPGSIAERVEGSCWMAQNEGRQYWKLLTSPPFDLKRLALLPCPFQYSLYQLMRNQVLAQALVADGAAFAQFAVCIHPRNRQVRYLREDVDGESDAINAFNSLLVGIKVTDIDPLNVVNAVIAKDPSLSNWGGYIKDRYHL